MAGPEPVVCAQQFPDHRAHGVINMKKTACLILLAATLPAAAWADCNYPAKPGRQPDGNTATREEMLAAKKVVDKYQADMNTYLTCIKAEYDASVAKLDASATEDDKKKLNTFYTQKNDAAVDQLQEEANRFNEQLRAFRAKNAK